MTKKELESLREFCVSRWPEKMGAIHGVGHWDRVAMFGKMLYQEGADKDVITGDITVNICFDSDRMDLLRVGILQSISVLIQIEWICYVSVFCLYLSAWPPNKGRNL